MCVACIKCMTYYASLTVMQGYTTSSHNGPASRPNTMCHVMPKYTPLANWRGSFTLCMTATTDLQCDLHLSAHVAGVCGRRAGKEAA